MKVFVFSVLDKAVGAFLQPFFGRSRAEGLRMFNNSLSNPDSAFVRNADDFVLYELGGFDDGAGIFDSREPERIISARECLTLLSDKGDPAPS